MFAYTMKPVLRVGVVRLAPVHDPVQKAAVGAGDILRDLVRLIQVIMPQQRSGTHEWLKRGIDVRGREETIDLRIQLDQRQATGTRTWAQRRQIRRGNKRLKSSRGLMDGVRHFSAKLPRTEKEASDFVRHRSSVMEFAALRRASGIPWPKLSATKQLGRAMSKSEFLRPNPRVYLEKKETGLSRPVSCDLSGAPVKDCSACRISVRSFQPQQNRNCRWAAVAQATNPRGCPSAPTPRTASPDR